MPRFLIDVNLPYRFSLWHSPDYVHMHDLGGRWPDRQIWDYARDHDMTVVSKDADFSDLAILSAPPPRFVHIRFGNVRMRDFHAILTRDWPWVCENIGRYRIIRMYADRVEGVGDDTP